MNIGLPLNQQYGEESGPDMGTFEAAFELAQMDTFVSGWARNTALDEMDGPNAKKLPPEELNEKYPFVQKAFTKPMSEVAAFHLNEEGKKRYALQQKIAQGPTGSLWNQAVNLGAGVVAHAMDPVEFGVGAFASMGLSAIGSLAAGSKYVYGGAKTIAQTMAGGGTAAGRFGAEAVEGILGNLALEPFMYNQSNRAQVDYSVEDAFVSVIGGGIAAPAAIFGIRKSWGGIMGKSKSASGLAIKTAIGQTQEGLVPNVDLVAKAHDDFIFREPPKGVQLGEVRSSYRFEPMDVTKANEKVFYVAGKPEDGRVIGEFFGEGTYATDNPNFANNLAAHPMEDFNVDVREIRLENANLLDANLPHKELLDQIVESVPSSRLKEILKEAGSIQDAWSKIRNRIDLDLNDSHAKLFLEEIRHRGFDGVALTDSVKGHNTVHLFPGTEGKAIETAKYRPDHKSVPSLDQAELDTIRDQIRSPENKIGFDAETWKRTKDFILEEEQKFTDINALDADTEARLKSFEDLAERGILDPETKAELEAIKARRTNEKSFPEAIEDFANCLFSGAN